MRAILIIFALALCVSACGKKAPLRPPADEPEDARAL